MTRHPSEPARGARFVDSVVRVAAPPPVPTPLLISFAGLPASGKSTIAKEVARSLRAAHVRVDTIEVAVGRAEGTAAATNGWASPPGYEIAYDVAADQLRLGVPVVADSVNPLRESRDAWRSVGRAAGARVLEVEVLCSDPDEHRRRAEQRAIDVVGLIRPTWDDILERRYEPWERDRTVVDTFSITPDEAAEVVLTAVRGKS
ncbi:AAA family ATPase [Actinomycetospora sp. OC33-EN08]|uniref:AAA family ATPase n=1 Tax=Actinomycetospora aurantiaca TaxID=3129233 RepID=A0ABU8ML36_9PSEU